MKTKDWDHHSYCVCGPEAETNEFSSHLQYAPLKIIYLFILHSSSSLFLTHPIQPLPLIAP